MSKYQLFPALDAATEAALRSSIQRWGVLQPVVKDQDGNIIDGHHRARIAADLGVDCPVKVRAVVDDVEARELAQSLNTDRRHLEPNLRRQMSVDLRQEGFSTTTIAKALGVSGETVRRDLAASTYVEPDTVVGADGKRYPATRPKIEQAAQSLAVAEPERTLADVIDEAEVIADVAVDVPTGVAEAVESRRVPQAVPKKTAGDGIPPHPATYPQAVLDIFAELAAGHCSDEDIPSVLDPFAGVGTIHQLRDQLLVDTVGVELEPEWAAAHPDTICGDSRRLEELLPDRWFDVIATSPAYGNRLADDYQASDPQARRSYAIDLGRSLTDGSGAGLHFDTDGEYEELHRTVWWQAVKMLRPGGLFLLNCKDFQRDGRIVPVTGWHVGVLADLGLTAIDIRTLPAAGLPFTTAKPLSELVVVLRKPYRKAEFHD
ncbi:MAG: ParB N-terminal domain-containing protein [Ilumatobacteraceae bacterium]